MSKLFQKSLQSVVTEITNHVVAKGLIDQTELNGTVIPEGASAQYIDLVAQSNPILGFVGYQNMGRHKTYRLNSFEMENYVLQSRPTPGNELDAANGSSGVFGTPTLTSADMVAFAALHDEAVETSIVDGQLSEILMSKLAAKAGINMTQMFYFGDTAISLAGATGNELKKRTLYKTEDGWIKKAGKKIYAADNEFDETNIADVLDKLEAQIADEYMDRTKLVYILNRSQFNQFQDLIVSLHPNTSVGVDATTGRKAMYYREIRVIEDLNIGAYVASSVTGGTGEVAMLARVDSLYYGIPEELLQSNTWRENKEFTWYVTNQMFPANTVAVPDAVAVAFYTLDVTA